MSPWPMPMMPSSMEQTSLRVGRSMSRSYSSCQWLLARCSVGCFRVHSQIAGAERAPSPSPTRNVWAWSKVVKLGRARGRWHVALRSSTQVVDQQACGRGCCTRTEPSRQAVTLPASVLGSFVGARDFLLRQCLEPRSHCAWKVLLASHVINCAGLFADEVEALVCCGVGPKRGRPTK